MPTLLLSDSLILLHGRGPHPGSGPALPQHPASTEAPLLSVLTAAESSVSSQEDTPTGLSDGADQGCDRTTMRLSVAPRVPSSPGVGTSNSSRFASSEDVGNRVQGSCLVSVQ